MAGRWSHQRTSQAGGGAENRRFQALPGPRNALIGSDRHDWGAVERQVPGTELPMGPLEAHFSGAWA